MSQPFRVRQRARRVSWVLAGWFLAATACGNDPTIVQPPTFERPGDVGFVCYDTQDRALVSLETCRGLTGTTEDRYAMTALVTQTASGEVGAVDLRTQQVLDADPRVPGFTFVRVGEFPTDILVSPTEPGVTYVASFGSRRVEYYATSRFRPDIAAPAIPFEREGTVPLGFGPIDLAMAPDGGSIFAALPRAGMIARIPVEADLTLSETFEMIALDPALGVPVAAPEEGSAYQRVCLSAGVVGTSANTRAASGVRDLSIELSDTTRPVRLLVTGDQLLVADASRPVLHRFRIGDTLEPLPPIATGVPLSDIAVTPEVPATSAFDETATERFLYAIDATDQTVLAIDFLEGSPTFGAVLPVHVGDGPSDRIRLLTDARTIAVVTPDFPEGEACEISGEVIGAGQEPSTLTSGHLRGVFLAVGLNNGLIQMVDVHDLNANCRGGSGCTTPPNDSDVQVWIRRHVARRATFISTGLGVVGTPTFSFEGAPGRLENDGSTDGGPRLTSIECPTFNAQVFPETGDPVICATSEVWAARSETWTTTYEGAIPGATSGRARIEADVAIVEGGSFCRRGVLGTANVLRSMLDAEDPEREYLGDQLVVTSDPPSSRASECADYFYDEILEERAREIQIPIVDAFQDRLVLDPSSPGLAELSRCYPSLFGIEVRTRGAFTVQGSVSGFSHRVVAGDEGRCLVDRVGQPIDPTDSSSFRNSRAFNNRFYQNPYVAFQISHPEFSVMTGVDAALTFVVGGVPPVLVADPGLRGSGRRPVILERLVFNDVDDHMYVVDSNSDGFVQYGLDPLTANLTFE